MKCKEHFERISRYLDGELGQDECLELERHLAECPGCARCLDSVRKTIRLCREMGKEKLPAEAALRLREKVLACLSEQDKKPSSGKAASQPSKGGRRPKPAMKGDTGSAMQKSPR